MKGHLTAEIKCIDGVYCPAEDTDLAVTLATREIRACPDHSLKVAEIGTGSGAIGISAAMEQNVSEVLMSDINESAIRCAEANAKLNGVYEKCSFAESDLFKEISGKFDMIIFNPPYLPDDNDVKSGKNEWSGGPTGIELTELFLKAAKMHLNPHGTIITVASSFADMKELKNFIKENSLRIKDHESVHIFFEDITALAIEVQSSV